MTKRLIDLDKMSHRRRDIYLTLANDAALHGKTSRAEVLRQVALGALPREWANLQGGKGIVSGT